MLDNIRQTRLALKASLADPIGNGFRSASARPREAFKLYANVRPATSYLHETRRYGHIDMALVRENTEGLYAGVEHFIPLDDDSGAVNAARSKGPRRGPRRPSKANSRQYTSAVINNPWR